MADQTDVLINSFKTLNPFISHPDSLEELLDKIIQPALRTQRTVERIHPNDPFFDRAKNLRQKYKLPQKGFENFQRLLCGIRDFPCILLQNPKNDELEFEEMIAETDSLYWLQEVLNNNGFNLDDIIVIDLFPMLTDTWLEEHPDESPQAIQDMFNLTLDFIHEFKLPIILSCQCFNPSRKTRKTLWASFSHTKIGDLRSSMNGAEFHTVSQFSHMTHTAHVVHGFHPAHLSYDHCEDYIEFWNTTLRTIFHLLFGPYAKYLQRYRAAQSEIELIRSSFQALHRRVTKFDRVHEQGLALDMFENQDEPSILDDWNDLKSTLDPILKKLSPKTPANLLLSAPGLI
ncbi:unnamed protein product [Penicillium nalgiovense]|uniref:Uncharacterized protein n=1 Tax=Penicillium nalgiovense TaxID=60175 RepID=A0A9W4I8Y9_PENNA|nr:unnamed protein product [Penicillium nalgiovense]CAG7956688.1 unnamed protein product [Penicillium nalgiovense]CAG7958296.1 unnamed protein product [Penicillium nalgiovense]CAG7966704.1 unnamed protein product [Penicillium nalgiovense]CAG7975481.1 unnamed protein product [Penicillium nalgiovense]